MKSISAQIPDEGVSDEDIRNARYTELVSKTAHLDFDLEVKRGNYIEKRILQNFLEQTLSTIRSNLYTLGGSCAQQLAVMDDPKAIKKFLDNSVSEILENFDITNLEAGDIEAGDDDE